MLRSFSSLGLALVALTGAMLRSPLSPAASGGVLAATIDPNDKGDPLFPDGHPNITYLTDQNWNDWMAKTDKPWLVDFYHPFCPHCKAFVPDFLTIASYFKDRGDIYVGALSCMDHVKCRRVGITGFPTLMAINFDKNNPGKEVRRIIGTHTVQEVKDYVDGLLLEAKINETGTQPPTKKVDTPTDLTQATTEAPKAGEQKRKELWEESTLPMTTVTRLRDAASAFIFGLKQGVFMGREILEDVQLDALKSWLQLVSKTFPGSINRKIISKLADKVNDIALLDFDKWDAMVNEWQGSSVFDFEMEESKLNFTGVTVPEWQRLSDIFEGHGNTYQACALYTCGQWNMFHMLTMNPPEKGARSDELMVSVIATMRRFIKHFFGCVQCRDHFLEYNNLEMVKKISDAENKSQALRRWLWEMHNAVNKRIRHYQWPKPNICPTCGKEGAWEMVEVDKWLSSTYAFREVVIPFVTEPPETASPITSSPKKELPALRKEEDPVTPSEQSEETNDKGVMSHTVEVFKPKDAEMGITNEANAKQLVSDKVLDVKTKSEDENFQTVRAPPMSLFAWYILPVAAVGGYLLFVRSRNRQKSFRHAGRGK